MQNEEVTRGANGEEGFLGETHFQGHWKDCGSSERRDPEEPDFPVEVGTQERLWWEVTKWQI